MRVALVTGEFPPDIGGTATHSACLMEELSQRGHAVTVVSLCDGARVHESPGIVRYPRNWPWPARLAAVAGWLLLHRRRYEVVYATSLHPAAVAGARLARRPVVVRMSADQVWERAVRLGLTDLSFDEFQTTKDRSPRIRAMQWIRNWSARHATTVVVPSNHLREAAEKWRSGVASITLIPSGVRVTTSQRATHHQDRSLHAVFVGRLIPVKRVDVLIDAVAQTQGVTLDVIGDGPERVALERRLKEHGADGRFTFVGRCGHDETLKRISAADVLVMSSEEEGLPTAAIEALALGTPVIATAVGGIPEVIQHERNGLLIESPDAELFAAALARLRDEAALRRRLAEAALQDGTAWKLEACADAVEDLFLSLISGRESSFSSPG